MIKLNRLATMFAFVIPLVGCADAATTADEPIVAEEAKETLGTNEQTLKSGVLDELLGVTCGAFLEGQEAELHSCCGQPGDRGNELGVGKFCFIDGACKGNKVAKYCSSAENAEGDHKSYFCSMPCDPASPTNTCGSNAACTCEESGACGCAPIACIESPGEGCDEV